MNWLSRFFLICGLLGSVATATGQRVPRREEVTKIEIRHIGPPAVSDDLVRANLRVKEGDLVTQEATNEDIETLRRTGYFREIRVLRVPDDLGVKLIYELEGTPVVRAIRFEGNRKISERKLQKKVTVKEGESLDSYKFWSASQEMLKMYQKKGYQKAEITVREDVSERLGTATVTFVVNEGEKVRVVDVRFVGAKAFSQSRLRRVIKTRRHWMFSWVTQSGKFKDEQFQEDREKLVKFYQDEGYIDFAIQEEKLDFQTPSRLVIEFHVFEGKRYHVGKVEFRGNQAISEAALREGVRVMGMPVRMPMLEGDLFTPKGLEKDREAVERVYGAKGYIGRGDATRVPVRPITMPNVETGTMDLVFEIVEGEPSHIEKIEIRGNTKTRDRVIRRELAVAPGELFNMVRVEISKQRLRDMQIFSRVETDVDPNEDLPTRKNLVVNIEEGQSAMMNLGAGFSSVENVYGFFTFTQGNFDLFNPPWFTGAGQKFRLHLILGTHQQQVDLRFTEPWFLGRRLQFSVDLYHKNIGYYSDVYDQRETGGRIGLYKELYRFLRGGVSYTLENIGIDIDEDSAQTNIYVTPITGGVRDILVDPPDISAELARENGDWLVSKVGLRLDYDRRGPGRLPNRGHREELLLELGGGPFGGDTDFYKLRFETSWYFRGLGQFFPEFARGHVLELLGQAGVVDSYGDSDRTHIWDRFFLGGAYTLRGYKYRHVGPRDSLDEPMGGNTFWMASAEYSIPIIERVRIAAFYDIGVVNEDAYDFDVSGVADDAGIGLRIDIPQMGPMRLDYAFPISYPDYLGGKPRFQFSVGWTRNF